MRVTSAQTEVLLRGISGHRVQVDQDGYSHVEAWDIRAMMNRVFGFTGWSLLQPWPPTLLYDIPWTLKSEKPGYKVAYLSSLALVVHDEFSIDAQYAGSAVGESVMPEYKRGDAHDMAVKTAESQALKRAASNLGDQFGLSLYRGGSIEPVVKKIVGFESTQSEREPDATT